MSSRIAKRKKADSRPRKVSQVSKTAAEAVYLPAEMWAEIGRHLSALEAVNLAGTIYSLPNRGLPTLVAASIHLRLAKALKILRMGALNFKLIYSAEKLPDNKFNILHLKHAINLQHYARRPIIQPLWRRNYKEFILDYGDRLLWTCDLKTNVLAVLRVKPSEETCEESEGTSEESEGTCEEQSPRLRSIRELYMFSTRCYSFLEIKFLNPVLTETALVALNEKGDGVLELINKKHFNQFNATELNFGNNVRGLDSVFRKFVIYDGRERAEFNIETIDIFSGDIFLERSEPEYEQKKLEYIEDDILYGYKDFD